MACAMQTLEQFKFIELNGMTVADPQKAYSILWWHLTGQRASAKTALARLTDLFTKKKLSQRWYFDLHRFSLVLFSHHGSYQHSTGG